MFKLIRKHQNGIMILVAALVIVAFAFLYDPNRDSYRYSDAMVEMYGKQVRNAKYQRIARTYNVIMQLGLYEYLFALTGLDRRYASQDNPSDDRLDFVFNSLLVRAEAERLGINPTTEEIDETIKGMQAFQTQGQFDPEKWSAFSEGLAAFGFDRKAIYEIVGDYVRFLRLQDLVSSGLLVSPLEAERLFEERNARIFASTALVPNDRFEAEAAVTDEEIAQYYEDNKDALLTPERRSIQYIHFKRPVEGDAPPSTDSDAPAEGGEDAEASDDNAATDATAAADPVEDIRTREKRFGEVVNEFSLAVVDPEDTRGFEEIAADPKFAEFSSGLQTTAPFPPDEPPADLAEAPELVAEAFTLTESRPVGNPVKVPDGYFFYKVATIAPPLPLTLDEAREEIRAMLHEQKLASAVNEAAAALKETLTAALAEGKSFGDAVADAGFEAREIPMFTNGQPPREDIHGNAVAAAVGSLNAGEISEPVPVEDGVLLVHLAARELPVDVVKEAQLAVAERQLETMDRQAAFRSWFQDRKTEANPIPLTDPRLPPPGPPT